MDSMEYGTSFDSTLVSGTSSDTSSIDSGTQFETIVEPGVVLDMGLIEFGTQFDFTYAPGTSLDRIIGFEMAGAIISSYLKDDVTVNIYVETTDQLPENVIGGALPGMKQDVKYDKLYRAMEQDALSGIDAVAVNSLANDEEFSVSVNGQELDEIDKIKLTNANAKALGLLNSSKKLDGYILMSDLSSQTNVNWDYDFLRAGDIAENSLDFLTVAIHEIGHILGFTSGLDDGRWREVVTSATTNNTAISSEDVRFTTPLDLFRYSSAGNIDLSIGADSYFSVDGGRSNLGYFSTGEDTSLGGDGFQASHWKHQEDNPMGIMAPALRLGERRDISSLDDAAIDVIGWDVDETAVLDWNTLYTSAVANAANAVIVDRSADVEKMIKDSDIYQGRGGSSGGGGWQVGLWQHITFQTLDVEILDFQPIPNTIAVAIDRSVARFASNMPAQEAELDENVEDSQPEVATAEAQFIEYSDAVADSDLGQSLVNIEDSLYQEDELLVMLIG